MKAINLQATIAAPEGTSCTMQLTRREETQEEIESLESILQDHYNILTAIVLKSQFIFDNEYSNDSDPGKGLATLKNKIEELNKYFSIDWRSQEQDPETYKNKIWSCIDCIEQSIKEVLKQIYFVLYAGELKHFEDYYKLNEIIKELFEFFEENEIYNL